MFCLKVFTDVIMRVCFTGIEIVDPIDGNVQFRKANELDRCLTMQALN